MTNNYQIIDRVILSDYTKLKDLYTKILSLKKDVFENNERIVFVYNPASTKILDVVNKLLEVVDIPNFFVLFLEDEEQQPAELDFIPKDTHCIYPWINLVVLNDGKVHPCCLYTESITDTPNIQNHSLTEIYNSQYMKDLRTQFRQGITPSGCEPCWFNESAGITSMRQSGEFKFKDIWYLIDYTQDNSNNLQILDLKLGNECNLSCRICAPNCSSTVADFNLKHNLISKEQFIAIKNNSQWSEQDDFYSQIEDIAYNLRYLDLYGGEPLMIRRHYDLLRKLIELDVSKNIELDYTSNGTIYSDSFFDIWQHFKKVKISFSLDNIGQRFELERNGAVWTKVEENIKKFNLKKSTSVLTDVFITISILNIYYLPELLEWIKEQEFSQPPTINILHSPDFLSIKKLTKKAKSLVLDKLQMHSGDPIISSLINRLDQLDHVESNNDFINHIQLMDRLRNQNFAVTHYKISQAMGYND